MVRCMHEADLDEVVQIHMDYFPEWRVTMLGRPFVRKMYRWFMKTHGDLALVVTKDEHVIGFTVGTVGAYKKSLFLYALPEVLWGIASNPGPVIYNSLSRFGARQTQASIDAEMTDFGFANNRIMVLSDPANGGGVDLMLAFESAAARRGTKAYFHDWKAPYYRQSRSQEKKP